MAAGGFLVSIRFDFSFSGAITKDYLVPKMVVQKSAVSCRSIPKGSQCFSEIPPCKGSLFPSFFCSAGLP